MTEDVKCPICGSETIIRTAKQGPNVGRKFHVCIRYPDCKGKVATKTIEDDQLSSDEHFTKGIRLSMQCNDYTGVLYHLNKALELGLSKMDEAIAYSYRGNAYLELGNLSEAEDDINKSLMLDETGHTALGCFCNYLYLTQIYERKGDIQRASEYMQEGINKLQTLYSSNNRIIANAYLELANLFISNKDSVKSAYEQAHHNYAKALELDPENCDLLFGAARFHALSGNIEYYDTAKAAEYFRRFLSLTENEIDEYEDLRSIAESYIEAIERGEVV